MKASWDKSFATPLALALIPLGVGVNLVMGRVVAALALPLFLDTTGTITVAVLMGTPAALATAVISQVSAAFVSGDARWLAFLPVHLMIAGYAVLCVRYGWFRSVRYTVSAGLGLGFLAATLSWPIAFFLFGGITAGGVTLFTTLLKGAGLPLEWAVYAASLSNDLLDKVVTLALVRTVLRSLPRRTMARFPRIGIALEG